MVPPSKEGWYRFVRVTYSSSYFSAAGYFGFGEKTRYLDILEAGYFRLDILEVNTLEAGLNSAPVTEVTLQDIAAAAPILLVFECEV